MDIFTKILENFGIKDFDQLNSLEQDTLKSWVDKVEQATITLEDIKNGITVMRQAIETELVNYKNDFQKDLYLKARLKNMILIETILIRPERARAALNSYITRAKIK